MLAEKCGKIEEAGLDAWYLLEVSHRIDRAALLPEQTERCRNRKKTSYMKDT